MDCSEVVPYQELSIHPIILNNILNTAWLPKNFVVWYKSPWKKEKTQLVDFNEEYCYVALC